MIGYMGRVVRMTISQFGDHRFKCIQHIEVGAGIEVGSGQSGGGMQNQQITNAGLVRMFFAQPVFKGVGDVNDFTLLARSYRQLVHGFRMLDELLRMYRSGTRHLALGT